MSKGLAFLKSAIVALATVGVVIPQAPILAADQKLPSKPTVKTLAANSIIDISLTKDGTFTGRTLDHTGAAIEGAKVVVKQGKTEIAETVTDEEGNFAVKNLKPGLYQVSSGATEGAYRLWSEQTAPPSAKPNGLLVMGKNGARGQFGGLEEGGAMFLAAGAAGAAGIAGLVVGVNAERKAKNTQDQLNSLLSKLPSP